MKKLLVMIAMTVCSWACAQETVKIYSPYSPSHSGTPAMLRVVERANASQMAYKFVLEFRPGGNQLLALRAVDAMSLAIIAPSFAEHVSSGTVRQDDWVPVLTLGEACWAVIVNQPVTEMREIFVGAVAPGNAAHLTAMMLGQQLQIPVTFVGFKSNNDALTTLVGRNGVNLVIDRWEAYDNLRNMNPNMLVLAASCAHRLPQAPGVPTLKELGIAAPQVFNIVVAHHNMNAGTRSVIAAILQSAQQDIGAKEIFRLSGMTVPSERVDAYYKRNIAMILKMQEQFKEQIQSIK